MSDSFSDELWPGVAGIYDAILAHPFLTGLTDGSLPHDAFAFYVVQDAIYLHGYAQALAAVASRAPTPAQTEMFARHAADAIAVEKTLHGSLLADLGIDPVSAEQAEPAPANLAYTSYLLATVSTGPMRKGSGRCCRATGSTGRSERNCCGVAHRIPATCSGSTCTPVRSSVMSYGP